MIAWLTVTYAVSLLSLSLGAGIWSGTAVVALLVMPLWLRFTCCPRDRARSLLRVAALLLAGGIIALGFWISAAHIDFSWDGAAYHQEAILRMSAGWPEFPRSPSTQAQYSYYLDFYPKAMWIIAASLYQATGNLEGAKLIHIVLCACAFLTLFAALARVPRFSMPAALMTAAAGALNPVTIYQSQSFYVDGQLGAMLTSLVGLIVLLVREPRRHRLVMLAALIVLIVNTKQTGVAYAGIFALASLFLIYLFNRRWFYRAFAAAGVGGVLAVLVFGYSPYVTNVVHYGNPFYPVVGEKERTRRPSGFDTRSGPGRLLISTFSEPSLSKHAAPRMRAPFMGVDGRSIARFAHADIRLGGWGVLFSGALLLGLAGWLFTGRIRREARLTALLLTAAVGVSTLINPEAWWARYAPQWYLLALIPGALLLLSGSLWPRLYGYMVIIVLLVNSALIIYAYFPYQNAITWQINERMRQIARHGTPVRVYFGPFPSNRIRLRDAGIEFHAVDDPTELSCRKPRRVFAYRGLFCFEAKDT